ncbi:MAG: hypothetical protein CMB67_05205 [Euryarchaeota archaeon]|nr:hypothetical protein [Euryarchaeota archaeon]
MVNLFRLLGLPNPSNTPKVPRSGREGQAEPGPRPGNRFHDLGESRWADRTERVTDRAIRRVIYIQPDDMHRLQIEGIEGNLSMGDMAIFDLNSLNHMPSQQSVCSRRVQDLGDRAGLPVFSLNEDDSMLMVAGAMMRVDTHKHMLGSPALDRAIEND